MICYSIRKPFLSSEEVKKTFRVEEVHFSVEMGVKKKEK
jgi:hypothetical protein